jgi:hypothetical protein
VPLKKRKRGEGRKKEKQVHYKKKDFSMQNIIDYPIRA